MSAAGTPATTTETPQAVPRWRRITCGVLVVLVCILAPVSLLAVWTHNTLLNTDQYVDTVAPLARDADIQEALADRLTERLTEGADLEKKVKDALPSKAAFVAPYVAQGIGQFVHGAALKILESDRFQSLWESANRKAHTLVVKVLTGNEGGRVTTKNGEVTIQLGAVAETVRAKLSQLGVDVFSNGSGKKASNEFVLFKSEDLTKVQGAVDLLDNVATWLPILLLLMLIAAIALSGNRRRTILRTAIWIAVGMALLLVIFNVARSFYLDAFPRRAAAGAAYDQVLSFLRDSARTALVVAVVVAVAAWLAGPGNLATRIREGVKGLVSGDRAPGSEPSSVGHFAARYKMVLRAVVIGIGLLILVILTAPTPLAVLIIVVLVVIGLLLVEFLARGGGQDGSGDAGPGAKSTATKAATKRST